jgi:hypothetical protein
MPEERPSQVLFQSLYFKTQNVLGARQFKMQTNYIEDIFSLLGLGSGRKG